MKGAAESAEWMIGLRARESRRADALFRDEWSEKLTASVASGGFELFAWYFALRTHRFDEWAAQWLTEHPDGVVWNLGAGYDTRGLRLGRGEWNDVDLPEVIAERRRRELVRNAAFPGDLEDESFRRTLVERMERGGRPVLLIAEGVFHYLRPETVYSFLGELRGAGVPVSVFADVVAPPLSASLASMWRVAGRGRGFAAGSAPEIFRRAGYATCRRVSVMELARQHRRWPTPSWFWRLANARSCFGLREWFWSKLEFGHFMATPGIGA